MTNYHTHTTWCDGRDSPEAVVLSAIDKGFTAIGFSSHMSIPEESDWTLKLSRIDDYIGEIRLLAKRYGDRIRIHCGGEADYIPGITDPDRRRYADYGLDYLIGSIHYVVAENGVRVPVDHTPELLAEGIRAHFGGDAIAYVKAYFRQQRDMVRNFDFDLVGHLDLVRKFNSRRPYFCERDDWYRDELLKTADAVADSGKLVEVNTGAISRGWMDDAYPSPEFRALLRERGVKFVLSSDAHSAGTIDCAFDRFAKAEKYVELI